MGGSDSDSTRTSLLITILSMTFTVISILVSAFEYVLSIEINQHGTGIMFKIPFESKMVTDLSGYKFCQTFVYSNKWKTTHLLAKTLYLSHRQVETLIPYQSKDGVIFTFIIMIDSIYFDRIWQELQQAVENESFIGKMKSIYQIKGEVSVDPAKLSKWTLGKHEEHVRELILINSRSPSASGGNDSKNDNKLSASQQVIVPSHTATSSRSIVINGECVQ